MKTSKRDAESAQTLAVRNIVSSAHLAVGARPELSEFEYGLIISQNAFNRWIVRCMAAAGFKDMTAMEVMVLHHVVHRDRAKKLADICFVLNVEDTHVVNYALKKLARLELVESVREGKEALYQATTEGVAACEAYRKVREQCLTSAQVGEGVNGADLSQAAGFLRMLSGLYDQASRAATSL